jgi:hypothetical protein
MRNLAISADVSLCILHHRSSQERAHTHTRRSSSQQQSPVSAPPTSVTTATSPGRPRTRGSPTTATPSRCSSSATTQARFLISLRFHSQMVKSILVILQVQVRTYIYVTFDMALFAGCMLRTKKQFVYGTVSTQIQLVPGNSAGTVTTYYVRRLTISIFLLHNDSRLFWHILRIKFENQLTR